MLKLTLEMLEPHRKRKGAYQMVFQAGYGPEVLADLARFCGAFETTWNENDRQHARAEGRREVYLRIMKHLNFTPAELAVHYDATLRIQE